jgi:hypothetical protein
MAPFDILKKMNIVDFALAEVVETLRDSRGARAICGGPWLRGRC